MQITAMTAQHLGPAQIGRTLLVSGVHLGVLTDYRKGARRVTLYLGGRVISVRRNAVCTW